MTRSDSVIQGQALFVEFRKDGATLQVIYIPDAFNTVGEIVWAKSFRRVLRSESGPKQKWQVYVLTPPALRRDSLREYLLNGVEEDYPEWEAQSEERVRNLLDYLDTQVANNYRLTLDKPLYVDLAQEDVEFSAKDQVSPALWARIQASRTAAGFPSKSIN